MLAGFKRGLFCVMKTTKQSGYCKRCKTQTRQISFDKSNPAGWVDRNTNCLECGSCITTISPKEVFTIIV